MEKVRIQKMLATAGVASRRAVEEMVRQGRITVNGEVVNSLPCFVEPNDDILVDGQPVRKRPPKGVYILLNKPRGVICTAKDEPGFSRPTALDLIPPLAQRVYTVGRLDAESTGLVLLTNDGELTNRLTHPRYGVTKTYVVRVDGKVEPEALAALSRGVRIDGRRTSGVVARVLTREHDRTLLEIELAEGPNREVRRVMARLGHEIRRLHRRAIGPISDEGVKIGHWRPLTEREVQTLRKATGMAGGEPGGKRPPRTTRAPKRTSTRAPKRPATQAPKPARRDSRRRRGPQK